VSPGSAWWSISFLTAAQVVAGIIAHSQGLIADGLHSLSDLVCDFLVLFAAHHSKDPADESHPYGHARIETAASFALGAILAVTGAGIIWSAGIKLQTSTTCRRYAAGAMDSDPRAGGQGRAVPLHAPCR
jgi:cation diffusion facilitator family transporter